MELKLEEFVYEGHLIPGFYINTKAELFSTRATSANRWTSHNKQFVCYGAPIRKLSGTKVGRYTMFSIGKKFTYRENEPGHRKFGVLAHRAVMETFSPFEENLPDDLVDEWENLSETTKRHIKNGWTVDHKEDLDEGFNSLSNLQWMTRSDNASKGDKQPTLLENLLWN